jgi:hypothetical protein
VGAGAGAGAGAGLAAYSGLSVPGLFIPYGYPSVAAGGAALIGGVVGAVAGESTKNIKKTKATLNDLVAGLMIQETMRDQFISVLSRQTNYSFALIGEKGPPAPDQEINYGFLADEGIDTVLELSALKSGLWGEKGLNPPPCFFMTVHTKLIRVTDGSVIYDHTFRYESGSSKFTDWASNNGQPFREQLDRCYRTLAQDILDKIISLDSSPKLNQTSVVDPFTEHIEEEKSNSDPSPKEVPK